MVTITDIAGNDLVYTPPADASTTAGPQGATVRLQAQIVETNTMLPQKNLSGTVNWGDGGQVAVFSGNGTVAIDSSRVLQPGDYVVSLYGHDYELPIQASAQVNYFIRVVRPNQAADPPRVVYGPILPRDAGFPGPQDWLFNSGSDLAILESSLKMLLTTAKGERFMEPDYGTTLRRLLFETNASNLDSLVQQEVLEAVSRWEPRVDLAFLQVVRGDNAREVIVNCQFTSKLNGGAIQLALQFQQ